MNQWITSRQAGRQSSQRRETVCRAEAEQSTVGEEKRKTFYDG
jgi:hypothetical protein